MAYSQIVAYPSFNLETRLKMHIQRITCMSYVKGHVWTASFSKNIIVINAKTRQSIHTLSNLPDLVTHFEHVRAYLVVVLHHLNFVCIL